MLVEEVKKRTQEDPLSELYQLDEDRHPSSFTDISVISQILDDLENVDVLRNTLRDMMIADEVAGFRILNQLENMIQGIKKEHLSRANKEWRHKFLSVVDLIY
jgi:hypothetical protein